MQKCLTSLLLINVIFTLSACTTEGSNPSLQSQTLKPTQVEVNQMKLDQATRY